MLERRSEGDLKALGHGLDGHARRVCGKLRRLLSCIGDVQKGTSGTWKPGRERMQEGIHDVVADVGPGRERDGRRHAGIVHGLRHGADRQG